MLTKYLKYKFKYLTLKSKFEFAESNKLDSGKMKYLNLKNFSVKNSLSSEKKLKDLQKGISSKKIKYIKTTNEYFPNIVSKPKMINIKETHVSIIYYKLLFQLLIEYAFIILKQYHHGYDQYYVDALNNFQFNEDVNDSSYNINYLEYNTDNNRYDLEFIYSILKYHIDNMPSKYREDVNFFSKNIIKELNKKYTEPLFEEEEKYYSIYDSRNYSIVTLNNIIMGNLDDIFLIYTETKLEDNRYHFTSHIFILKRLFDHTKKYNNRSVNEVHNLSRNNWSVNEVHNLSRNNYTCEFISIQQSLLLLIGANKYNYKYQISKILFDYIQNLELFINSYLAYAYAWPKISHILKKYYNFLSIAYKAESNTKEYNINRNHYLPIELTGKNKNYYILTFRPSEKFLKDYPLENAYV